MKVTMLEVYTTGCVVRIPLVPLAALSLLGSLAGGVLTLVGVGRGLVRKAFCRLVRRWTQ